MSVIVAFILGIVQGITEFFPISSSAHVEIVKKLLNNSSTSIFFDLSCHLGTLLSLIWFLRKEILIIFRNKKKESLYVGVDN